MNLTIPCADRIQRNYNPHVLLVEVQSGTATLGKTVWQFLIKSNLYFTYAHS